MFGGDQEVSKPRPEELKRSHFVHRCFYRLRPVLRLNIHSSIQPLHI